MNVSRNSEKLQILKYLPHQWRCPPPSRAVGPPSARICPIPPGNSPLACLSWCAPLLELKWAWCTRESVTEPATGILAVCISSIWLVEFWGHLSAAFPPSFPGFKGRDFGHTPGKIWRPRAVGTRMLNRLAVNCTAAVVTASGLTWSLWAVDREKMSCWDAKKSEICRKKYHYKNTYQSLAWFAWMVS